MKNILLAGFLLITSTLVHADSIGFSAGAFYWYTDASGTLSAPEYGNYELNLDEKSLEGQSNAFYFLALEHPVPYLPNIRLGQTNLTHDGFGVLHFLGTDYAFRGTIDLSHTDVTGYYEVLDNIVSLDLGLTARIFDGEIKTDFIASTIPLDSVYALLYANVQVDIPATGLALGAIMNVGDNGDERGVDVNAYLQYTSFFGLGFTTGYRYLDIDMESDAKAGSNTVTLFTNFTASGPYAALHYRF